MRIIRRWRHGPLRQLGPVWVVLGELYREVCKFASIKGTCRHHIGQYGPFVMNGEFAFSDFENWGTGHNNGFEQCIEACRGMTTVFDIGAHIGLVTMPISSVLDPAGKVYAFEPAEANRGHLRDHLQKNAIRNVEIVASLVGDCNSEQVRFYEQSGATGQNALAIKKNHHAYHETVRPQITLDHFCASRKILPDVIKIDVEGAELSVLRGATKILKVSQPIIFLSVHPVEISLLGSSIDELENVINALGYECREMDGQPVAKFRLAEYQLLPRK